MDINRNPGEMDQKPIEDGLSALRRLAALDRAKAQVSQQPASQEDGEMVEVVPDWLELLLAKYGEEASLLIGIKSKPSGKTQPEFVLDSSESSQVASLLDQMAAEAGKQPSVDRLATSVDWGGSVRQEEEEEEEEEEELPYTPGASASSSGEKPAGIETGSPGEEVPDWLQELAATTVPPEEVTPTQPVLESSDQATPEETSEEIPDWLARLTMGTAAGAEPPASPSPAVEREEGEQAEEVSGWLHELGSVEEAAAGEPSPELAAESLADSEEEIPDWLRDLESMQADQSVASALPLPDMPAEVPSQSETEVPDWSLELDATEEMRMSEAPPEAMAESGAEIPDWLRQLEAAEEMAQGKPEIGKPPAEPTLEVPSEAFEEPEEQVPDWLHQLEASAAETGAEVGEQFEPEIPDWLASLRREEAFSFESMEEEVTPTEHQPGETVEEPDWLAALRSTGQQDPWSLDQEVVDAEEEEIPAWLEELRTSQAPVEAPEEMPEGVEPEPEIGPTGYPARELEIEFLGSQQSELPAVEEEEHFAPEEVGALDWLTELEAAAALEEPSEEVPLAREEGALAEEELPDWLRELPPADLLAEAEIPESEREIVETAQLPEWLALSSVEEGEAVSPVEEIEEIGEAPPAEETLAPTEVPDWLLKLKPEEEEPLDIRREETAEAEDVLAGIPGLLPVAEEELEREEEPIAALRSRISVPEVADVEAARLFKEIAAEQPAEPVQEAREKVETGKEARRRQNLGTLAWGLIFIVLIIAIALALVAVLDRVGNLLGGSEFREFFGSARVIDPAPVNTFRAQVTKLSPDAAVVVSFEYSPATEAEMDLLGQVIMRDLLENQARVIGVSLRPEGAALAQRMFNRFTEEYPYGQRTINLGYLPGQTMGVRNLAFLSSMPLFQSGSLTFQDYPAWQDISNVQDVALVVVVADSPPPVRWWVEQMGPGTRGNRPMVAAVSAGADPSVRPYYNQIDPKSGQLLGLLSGVRDAAAYENRLGEPGGAVQSLAAQSVAHLGLVAICLGGTVAGFRIQATRDRE